MGEQYTDTLNLDSQNRLTSARFKNGKWVTDVHVIGRSSKVIKKYENVASQYYANSTSESMSSVVPLDVSEYQNLMLYIRNDDTVAHDVRIRYHYGLETGISNEIEREELGTLNAGESMLVYGDDASSNHALLNKPIIGLTVQTLVPNNGFTIVFMGAA